MTYPVKFLIRNEDGEHHITITPVNVDLGKGLLYATGEYVLSEDEVGMGSIVFDADDEWRFDGVSDLSKTDMEQIVAFIRAKNNDENQPEIISGGGTASAQTPSEKLNFILSYNGQPAQIQVEIEYPAYLIAINGNPIAKLEQDHHSNWFVASGHLEDALVQEIGKRIVAHIMGD